MGSVQNAKIKNRMKMIKSMNKNVVFLRAKKNLSSTVRIHMGMDGTMVTLKSTKIPIAVTLQVEMNMWKSST